MGRPSRFAPEVRERAIRLVIEQRPAHPSEWAALQGVATKLGTTAETLRTWVRQVERDTGQRPGLTTRCGRKFNASGTRITRCTNRARSGNSSAAKASTWPAARSPAIYARQDHPLDGLVHHSDAWSRYLSMRHTDRLADAGITPSVGSQGDAYDNAIGLFKTEVIRRLGPWRNLEGVEFATLTWVDWFNPLRLLELIGYAPPAEFEARYYEQVAVA